MITVPVWGVVVTPPKIRVVWVNCFGETWGYKEGCLIMRERQRLDV